MTNLLLTEATYPGHILKVLGYCRPKAKERWPKPRSNAWRRSEVMGHANWGTRIINKHTQVGNEGEPTVQLIWRERYFSYLRERTSL